MLFSLLLLFAGQSPVDEAQIRMVKEIDQHALNLTHRGAYSEAARQFVRSLQKWQELSARRPIDLVGPHFNLASTYLALGMVSAAQKEAQLARASTNNDTPPADLRRVSSLMAQIYYQKRQHADAERELRGILPDAKGLERSTILNDLGMARASMGDLEGSRKLLEKAVAERFALEPSGSPDLGQFVANLALVRYKQGDAQIAVSLYGQAIPMLERLPLGPVRIRLGMALAEFSQALKKLDRKREAKTADERARAVFRENNPSNHTIDVMSFR